MFHLSELRADQFFDLVETIALIVIAVTLIYVMLLLRNEMRAAAAGLKAVLDGHAETTASIERVWSHIHEIEVRLGIHQTDSSRRPPS
jgi:hypothetical protein